MSQIASFLPISIDHAYVDRIKSETMIGLRAGFASTVILMGLAMIFAISTNLAYLVFDAAHMHNTASVSGPLLLFCCALAWNATRKRSPKIRVF